MAKAGITIYHNPKCSTSRTVLEILRGGGHEPQIVEYLKTPPSRAELKRLIKQMGAKPADVLRWKEPLAKELKLDRDASTGDEVLDAMAAHPILINRPIVVTAKAVKLCRPSETVREIV
jgi:arsenate reductase (glutaredoxin)